MKNIGLRVYGSGSAMEQYSWAWPPSRSILYLSCSWAWPPSGSHLFGEIGCEGQLFNLDSLLMVSPGQGVASIPQSVSSRSPPTNLFWL